MLILLVIMTLALLIPIYSLFTTQLNRSQRAIIWSKMLAFASVSTKTSVMILVISVWRDDWMVGLVGVLILSVGNAAIMLLAHTLRRCRLSSIMVREG
ncbi:MAG: hypothetical protein AAF703_16540 [Cyanobacteria bacterium P01_D01_bin.105]